MAKWLSKEEEKLKIIKISKIKTIDKTALEYGIGRSSIKEWIKAYKLLGEKVWNMEMEFVLKKPKEQVDANL